jgi:putative ABC transport system permease protein
VRFADLLKLSLSALGQQKVRTLLTTLGVVFGTFVLANSLSVGHGVQDTITREAGRYGSTRRIEVWPIWGVRDQDIPEEALEVKGEMSEARRKRLRDALRQRWSQEHGVGAMTPLDTDRVNELAALEHVEHVGPLVATQGWLLFGDQVVQGGVTAVGPENTAFRDRLVAGEFFESPDERAALVSEFLLYRLGLVEEADMSRALGKTIRVEFRSERQAPGLVLSIVNPDRPRASRDEERLLAEVARQLPSILDRLDLTEPQRDALRRLATPGKQPEAAPAPTLAAEFVIKGVLRQPTPEDFQRGEHVGDPSADLVLPQKTGQDLYARQQAGGKYSYGHVTVTVDREENVRDVAAKIQAMRFHAHARIEFIERERFQYLLIFYSMTIIAGVALLVAALGIANTMLMTVLERTREVGVMKAVGAADRHIRRIFLVEGGLIGLVGGTLGVLLAWGASFPLDAWIRSAVSAQMKIDLKESLFVFPAWLTLGCVAFACVVTTVAAVYPAHRAARVNPIAALRHE